jgi:hypothetical protein
MKSLFLAILITMLGLIIRPVAAVDYDGWSDADKESIQTEINQLSTKIGNNYLDGIVIYHLNKDAKFYSCWSTLVCFGNLDYSNNPKLQGLIIHEVGHRVLRDLGFVWSDLDYSLGYYHDGSWVHVSGVDPKTGKYRRTDLGFIEADQPYCQHCSWMNPDGQSYKEDFADMFMAFVMGYFSNDPAGEIRKAYMEDFINNYLRHSTIRNGSNVLPPAVNLISMR